MKARPLLFICGRWTAAAEPVEDDVLLSRPKWIEFVDRHSEVLAWYENTERGKDVSQSLQSDNDPEKRLLERNRAVGHFDKKKGYHKFAMLMYPDPFKVRITFDGMRPNRPLLLLSLELADHLGVSLFDFARKKPMTREWIDKNYPEKTKAEKS